MLEDVEAHLDLGQREVDQLAVLHQQTVAGHQEPREQRHDVPVVHVAELRRHLHEIVIQLQSPLARGGQHQLVVRDHLLRQLLQERLREVGQHVQAEAPACAILGGILQRF